MPHGLRLLALLACGVSWCCGDSEQCELTPFKTCKLKVGIVGGGTSLLTFLHNVSIHVTGTRRIVAGAFNAKPEKALENARKAGVTGYGHWKDMLDAWQKGDQDLDYVVILSRNKDHSETTKAFLEAGLPVFCERPMTSTAAEAEEIQKIVQSKSVPFVMGHWFTGHPMLMFAKDIIQKGVLGDIRKVESWLNQDWAAELTGYSWRFDPKVAGNSGIGADIGINAYSTATWVTGRAIKRVSARLMTFNSGRELEENSNVMAEFDNGGIATILASAISVGFKNEHGIRIFGSKGSLEWSAGSSKVLVLRFLHNVYQVLSLDTNRSLLPPKVAAYPLDASLANLHTTMERLVRHKKGEDTVPAYEHPGVAEGAAAMRYLEATIESSKGGGAWTEVKGADR
mmetsp:Transcript_116883/g.342272  ORF Transcript_116883/g.342272 Transcript_116883/m.342272 type:complete len:398 (+) Transcript_116883:69-1262(+)